MIKTLLLFFVLSSFVRPVLAEGEGSRASGKADHGVFESASAEMAPDIFGDKQKTTGVLRVLTVDERVGQARKKELVRVPVFFHKGECKDPDALSIVPVGGGDPVPYQADDIRRDATGAVARMHLWFYADVEAWGRKQYNLIPGKNPASSAKSPAASGGQVTLAGEDIKVTFHTDGKLMGAISAIETKAGKVTIPEGNFAPETKLLRQNAKLAVTRTNEINYYTTPEKIHVKDMRWAAGPLFSKLILKLAPLDAPEDIAEYRFIIPAHGNEFQLTQLFYPEEKDSPETVGAKGNALLTGKIVLGDPADGQETVTFPAGLRKELATVFNYRNKALVNKKAKLSLFAIPFVQNGAGDIGQEPDGRVFFCGAQDFQRKGGSNSESLRVFFGQSKFVFSDATQPEELRLLGARGMQPLTAAVDEPWATPDDLWNFAKEVNKEFWKIEYWGRPFEANLIMNHLSDKPDGVKWLIDHISPGQDLRALLPTQEEIAAAKKKSQGAGGLDPYQITYSFSAIVPFSEFVQPEEALAPMAALKAEASRLVNGGVTKGGWPHVRSFANASNMHQGTYLCGIWGGRKTDMPDLVQWCLDAATSQNYRARYGHGQSPYSMNEGGGDASDVLYMAITDFYQRAIELACDEDLSIHSSAYGRYFDMVDVNSDIYQRKITEGGSEPSWWRATMLRGQAHDHRWEAFGCDPFLGMLAKTSDGGKVGLTEACYYMHKEIGTKQNWNNLMTDVFLPAALVAKGLAGYTPPELPALPGKISVGRKGGKNLVTWEAVPGATGYRVFRAENTGGPWTWVNSPYTGMPGFTAPTKAEKDTAKAKADAENEAKAKAMGIDPKKLKSADKVNPWEKLPPPSIPLIPDTLVKGTTYEDPEGKADSIYLITAQDKHGRQSDWFPEEPKPE